MGKLLLRVLIIAVLFLVFKNWILPGVISSGDFGYYSREYVEDIKFLGVWDPTKGGMGASVLSSLWFKAYSTFVVKFSLLLGWNNYIHIFWYFPYIIFSFLSATFLFKTLFKNNFLSWVAGFIYIANTYSLMVVAGGQMGVALAYSVAPLILVSFIKLIDRFTSQPSNFKFQILNFKLPIIVGLSFAVLVMLDLRLAYIMMAAVGLYILINFKFQILNFKLFIFTVVIPLGITGLLHTYWLLPAVLSGGSTIEQLGDIYTSSESVKFFSFAKLENTLSLLHPNWPENIFGKVYFMRWEFLLLPILAYSSLFFINSSIANSALRIKKNGKESVISNQQSTNRVILFFGLLGLVGAFLAKGANEPFGQIYLWMFDHVPGFVMFRDPTKWYLLVALSYAVLIPFSIYNIYSWLSFYTELSKSKIFNLQNIFVLLLTSYFLFLIHPALLGQLNGTLRHMEVPREYHMLDQYLSSQPQFFRTLWVPAPQRFGFYSNFHPAIPARVFFDTTDNPKILKNLDNGKTKELLIDSGVKYVILPYDSQGEIFLEDRHYDERQYLSMVKQLQKITWLREVDGFGKIKVFEVDSPKDHFWTPSKNMNISYEYIDPTKYSVSVVNARKGDKLIFAESFDPSWKVEQRNTRLSSSPYNISTNIRLNSFVLPEDGDYKLEVYYAPQRLVDIGLWISGVSLLLILGSLVLLNKQKNR